MNINEQVFEAESKESPCAVIMAPMMAAWDHGEFCRPLTELLLSFKYRLVIFDSMDKAKHCDDLEDAAQQWAEILITRYPHIDLAVGQAYGGALIQYMLGSTLANCKKFLGISAPTYCDDTLRAGLGDILQSLSDNDPEGALQKLEWWVLAKSSTVWPKRPIKAPPETQARLRPGLLHLSCADARQKLASFHGKALWLYGEESKLVGVHNIVPASNSSQQRAIGLPRCGMRPLYDARSVTLSLIEDFLKETLS